MKRKMVLLGLLLFGASMAATAQQTQESKQDEKPAAKPADAQVLMDAALKKAKDQKKAVFVLFDASW